MEHRQQAINLAVAAARQDSDDRILGRQAVLRGEVARLGIGGGTIDQRMPIKLVASPSFSK